MVRRIHERTESLKPAVKKVRYFIAECTIRADDGVLRRVICVRVTEFIVGVGVEQSPSPFFAQTELKRCKYDRGIVGAQWGFEVLRRFILYIDAVWVKTGESEDRQRNDRPTPLPKSIWRKPLSAFSEQ